MLLMPSCHPEKHPIIVMHTNLGDITLMLFLKEAPVTANHFLEMVRQGRYDSACFYRVVTPFNQPDKKIKIEVIQGGLQYHENIDTIPGIFHEDTRATGLKHLDGTLSMARNEPGTASTEFFICIGNQPELDFDGKRNPDGKGFAAFGQVIQGMEVVRRIQQLPANSDQLLLNRLIINEMRVVRE